MAKQTIAGTDTVNAALLTKCVSNFTELYNMLTGVAASTLLTPTIASLTNATHTHANAAGGGTLTAAVLGGTITGTYTLGGTPTITAPTITGSSNMADLATYAHSTAAKAGGLAEGDLYKYQLLADVYIVAVVV